MFSISPELASFAVFCIFYTGFALGAYCYRKPAKHEIVVKVDAEFLYEVDNKLMYKWADDRGVVWMPKGIADITKKVKAND